MKRTAIAAALGVIVGLSALPVAASAQGAGRYFDPGRGEAPPLVIRKRPFTDSGTVVPQSYEQEYMTEQTTLARPTYSSYTPDRFGQHLLPRPFDGLGLN